MPAEPSIDTIRESFLLALLLTGTAIQAEEAVQQSILMLPSECARSETLLLGTATAAARLAEAPGDSAAPAWLPVELQRVLPLPRTMRQCYVLRILAGWPGEKCAETLQLNAAQVDEEACRAAWKLGAPAGQEIPAA